MSTATHAADSIRRILTIAALACAVSSLAFVFIRASAFAFDIVAR